MSQPKLEMSVVFLEILYDALRAERGLVVEASPSPEHLRQRLYALRKTRPEFGPLAFLISPINPQDLWVIKTRPADPLEEL